MNSLTSPFYTGSVGARPVLQLIDGGKKAADSSLFDSEQESFNQTFDQKFGSYRPNILILEDDQFDQMLLEKTLAKWGYPKPAIATNAEEAFDLIGTRPIDIGLLDIVMPGRLDGIDFANQMISRSKIPVIFCSSHTSPDLMKRALEAHPHGYLKKPLDSETLHITIQLAMVRHGLENRLNIALSESQRIAEQIADAILVVREDGYILFANKAAGRLFQKDPSQLIGDHFGIPLSSADKATEIELIQNAGRQISCELRTARITWRGQSALLTSIRDITNRKKLEEDKLRLAADLHQVQKMESIGTLAGGIAHDFNNILAAILGYSELAQDDLPPGSPVHHEVDQIIKSALRAKELVRQLLAFSRKGAVKKGPVSLNRVVNESLSILERVLPKTVNLRVELGDVINPINANSQQLEQILINLATNAADAASDRGAITIRTKNVILERCHCDVCGEILDGEYVMLSVKDDGSGMSPETICNIFDPFYTTKEVGKGTGLGLSTVYGIVTDHGGHISCQSEIGKGTNFSIYFPTDEITITEEDSVHDNHGSTITGEGTILVVDDESAIRDLAKLILTRNGYKVLLASTGEEALDVYEEKKDLIDLVLMDLGMPGMGGKACLQTIKRIHPEAKVLIASGYAQYERTDELASLGAAGMVSKPYRKDDLLVNIKMSIDN